MPDSLRLGILSVAGLLATFAFNAALIYVLGVGDDVDSYVAAFTIPQFLNVIFASGCFSVLVPHYANKDKAYQTCHASQLLRIAFPLSVIFSAFLCVFSGSWVAFAFENVFAKQPDLLLQLSMFFLLILPAWAVFLVATSVLFILGATGTFIFIILSPKIFKIHSILSNVKSIGIILGTLFLFSPVMKTIFQNYAENTTYALTFGSGSPLKFI